jgi:hypothetical protein
MLAGSCSNTSSPKPLSVLCRKSGSEVERLSCPSVSNTSPIFPRCFPG